MSLKSFSNFHLRLHYEEAIGMVKFRVDRVKTRYLFYINGRNAGYCPIKDISQVPLLFRNTFVRGFGL